MPLAHTLLTVVQRTESGNAASSAACRAGACPQPACSTWPMKQSVMDSRSSRAARATAAWMASAPSRTADRCDSLPPKEPMGVRAKERMHTSSSRKDCTEMVESARRPGSGDRRVDEGARTG
eukprot:ctg_5850.g689